MPRVFSFPQQSSSPCRLWAQLAAWLMWCCPAPAAELSRDAFANPPIEARPSALWTWMNASVDHGQLTRELEEMKAKGMRGAIIWDMGALTDPQQRIPHGPAFLSPESLASIHHAMDEAERLGLELGISSASSWNAGGPWVRPEDGCQTVAWSTVSIDGPKAVKMTLPLPERAKPPTTILSVSAVPAGDGPIDPAAVIPLDDHLDANGTLTWQAPAGRWSVMVFVSTATGQQLMCPSPKSRGLMTDHLSARATDQHINHVLDKVLGGRKGTGSLKVLFLDSYEVKTPVDWTPLFVEAFEAAYGYDPLPWLPVLAGHTVESQNLSDRFRHDYGQLVSDLVTENHFARARELANQRGLQLLAEAGHGGHARFDPLKSLGAADIPMGEYWNHRKNWCTKEAASAANLYGKPLVNAEAMTGWQHWQDGPEMYKRLTDIAFCAGLNQITFHTFAHNPPQAGLPGNAYHAGEHFNVNLTWWNQARPMIDSLSRSCQLLQQGRFVADVLAYYGDGAPNLVPARRITPTVNPRWPEDHCLHCGKPHPVDLSTLGHGHDYDYLNKEVLLDRLDVRDGRLTLPNGITYRVLVLPNRRDIAPDALAKIEQLVRRGATVIGPKPERSNSMKGYPQCDDEVRAIADRLWGDCDGERILHHRHGKGRVLWNVPIDQALADIRVAPDFTAEGIDNNKRQIDYIHRTTGTEDIYFVCNTSDQPLAFHARFRVGAGRSPHLWDPEDGSVTPCLHYEATSDSTRLPLELAPASSVFVVFSRTTSGHVTDLRQTSPSGAGVFPTAMVARVGNDSLDLMIREPGSYTVTTSHGLTGSVAVSASPYRQPIEGPWTVDFQPDRGAPSQVTMQQLTDWTRHPDVGVRHFSGTASYRQSFVLPKEAAGGSDPGDRLMLDLGEVHETAVVTVNGHQAGILWKPPYRIDITPHVVAGRNTLTVAVTNSWNNRLVGDAGRDDKRRITHTNMSERFKSNSPLLPSGMLGPVGLETIERVNVTLQKP